MPVTFQKLEMNFQFLLLKIEGLEKYSGNKSAAIRLPIYGLQRVFNRREVG